MVVIDHEESRDLMEKFIKEKPEVWYENRVARVRLFLTDLVGTRTSAKKSVYTPKNRNRSKSYSEQVVLFEIILQINYRSTDATLESKT